MAFITYEQAVHHLKQEGVLDVSPEDPDLALKLKQASALVMLAMKRPAEWDVETLLEDDPEFAVTQATTLRVLAFLYRYRGDEENRNVEMSVEDILRNSGIYLVRVPTIA
jgi:hypothetical protein